MTIKFLQMFIISTLLTYITLITVASDIGIIQYQNIKSNNNEKKSINLQIEKEINELENEINQLQNQEQVLDLAFDLGYVNSGDKLHNINIKPDEKIYNREKISFKNNINSENKYFSNWTNLHFFLLSLPISIAISVCYLLLSKAKIMEKKHE